MNIYLRELRAYRKSIIIWCVCNVLLIASSMNKYSAIYSGTKSSANFIESMPKSLRVLMGGSAFDLSIPVEYYGAIFMYLVLMAAIHAALLGAGIISKEERDKTAEFLMVKPVSRSKIVTSKLLAAVTNIVVFNLTALIFSIGIVAKYSKGEPVGWDIAKIMIGMFLIQLFFMAIGVAFAGARKNASAAGGISIGILMLMFVISMVVDMKESLGGLRYITPFKYLGAEAMLKGKGFSTALVVLTLAVTTGLIALAYIRYSKRDLGH